MFSVFLTFYFKAFFAERELNSGVINNLVFRNITDCGDLFVLLSGEEEGLGHDAGVDPLGVVSLENVKRLVPTILEYLGGPFACLDRTDGSQQCIRSPGRHRMEASWCQSWTSSKATTRDHQRAHPCD